GARAEGVRAARAPRDGAGAGLHEGGAAARRLGLPHAVADTDPRRTRLAPAPQAACRGSGRAARRERVGGGLSAAGTVRRVGISGRHSIASVIGPQRAFKRGSSWTTSSIRGSYAETLVPFRSVSVTSRLCACSTRFTWQRRRS